jgi:DNA-binding response OmpR family regulator
MKPIVFVADDDVDFNRLILFALTKFGMECKAFQTPESLKDALTETQPELLILDLQWGGHETSGLELIQELRNDFYLTGPILIASGLAEKGAVAHAVEAGASDFIFKPMNREVFISKLMRWVRTEKLEEQPLYSVHSGGTQSYRVPLSFDFRLKELDETGVLIESKVLIPRGAVVTVEIELLQSITQQNRPLLVTASRSWAKTEPSSFETFCEFDSTDQTLQSSVRNWLLRNTPL